MPRIRTLRTSPRFRESGVAFALAVGIFCTGLCDPVQAKIVKFDPPGSSNTMPTAINASRWITGIYVGGNNGDLHSFLRVPDGSITTIDVQDATCGTYANSINSSGVIV